jgi:UDPglucose 6-dehydrogenase
MSTALHHLDGVELCPDAYEAARGAEALVVCTDWNEFKQLDLERLRALLVQPIIVDGRNIYQPERMRELGFTYLSVGRPAVSPDDASIVGAPVQDRLRKPVLVR